MRMDAVETNGCEDAGRKNVGRKMENRLKIVERVVMIGDKCE